MTMAGATLPYDETVWTKETRESHRDLERLIRWYFPLAEQRRAIWVAWRVSNMSPLAFHRHSERGIGLFDIDPAEVGLPDSEAWLLHNPIRNVAAAYRVWRQKGWARWPDTDEPPKPFAS